MAINLVTKLTAFESLLEKNNTTTSSDDISSGLKAGHRIKYFFKGVDGFSSRAPIANTMYPVIFTEMVTTPEDIAQLGASAKRNIEINFKYVVVTNYGAGSDRNPCESMENADMELLNVVDNITALLRQRITLSNTMDDSSVENIIFNTIMNEPKTFNCAATIEMSAHILST